jgi:putative PIN family toxin of toxin-antitoxin system
VRVFLDTNVLVAAFATRGLCADVLRATLAEHELLISQTVIQELNRTLALKVRVPEPVVREIVTFLQASASMVKGPPRQPLIEVRDPDDAVILGEALAGGADILVSGDKDLLELGNVPGIRIMNPRGFWQHMRRQS